MAPNAWLNLLHCLAVTKAFSSDGSVSLRVYGQVSWCCCMVQGWAWTGYLQSVVPLPAGGAPWPLLMSSRSCSLMGTLLCTTLHFYNCVRFDHIIRGAPINQSDLYFKSSNCPVFSHHNYHFLPLFLHGYLVVCSLLVLTSFLGP